MIKKLSLIMLAGLMLTSVVMATENNATNNFNLIANGCLFPDNIQEGNTYPVVFNVIVKNPNLIPAKFRIGVYDGLEIAESPAFQTKNDTYYSQKYKINWTPKGVGNHMVVFTIGSNVIQNDYEGRDNYMPCRVYVGEREQNTTTNQTQINNTTNTSTNTSTSQQNQTSNNTISGTYAKLGEKFVLSKGQAVKITDYKDKNGNPYMIYLLKIKKGNDTGVTELKTEYNGKTETFTIKEREWQKSSGLEIKAVEIATTKAEFTTKKAASGSGSSGGSGGRIGPISKPKPMNEKGIQKQVEKPSIGTQITQVIKSIIWGSSKPMTGMATQGIKQNTPAQSFVTNVLRAMLHW